IKIMPCYVISKQNLWTHAASSIKLLFLLAFTGGFPGRALFGGFRFALRLAFSRLRRGGFAFGRSSLCLFGLAGRQVRSGEALAIESNFRNSYRGKGLAMSINLLVLLFALEVEDQNLVSLAAFHYLGSYYSASARTDGAFLARDGQNVVEL